MSKKGPIPHGIDRRKYLASIGLAAGVSVAGCSTRDSSSTTTQSGGDQTTTSKSQPSVGGQWIQGQTSGVQTLIPFLSTDEISDYALARVLDYGAFISPDLEPKGLWFENWEMNDANDVIRYKLRENLQYGGDLGQVTVDDYLYSLKHIHQNKENWAGYNYVSKFYIDGEPINYVKEGKYTFRAELPSARANRMFNDYTMWMRPLPKGILEKYVPSKDIQGLKKDEQLVNASWTGNLGPFTLDEWKRQSHLTFKRNENYYLREAEEYPDDIPYFESYKMQQFNSTSAISSALKTGGVTASKINPFKADTFEQADDVQVVTNKYGSGLFYVTLNQRLNGWEGFRNKDVRQAFAMALDKQTMIQNIQQGYATPAHTWSPVWGPYYSEEGIWKPDGPRIEEAKSKIESALDGYTYENGKLKGPDSNQVELKLAWVTGSKTTKLTKDYLQSQFNKLGVSVTLQGVNWTTMLGKYCKNSASNTEGVSEADWVASPFNGGPWDQSTSPRDWDIMTGVGFDHGAYTPWSVIQMLFTTRGSYNWAGYVPPESFDLNTKLQEAAAAGSREKTKSLLQSTMNMLSEEQPVLFSMTEKVLTGYRDRVAGLDTDPENFYGAVNGNSKNRQLYFEG